MVKSTNPTCASNKLTVQWSNGTFKECLLCKECQLGSGLYPHKCGDTVTFPADIKCKNCESGKRFSDTSDTSECKLCHSCAEHEIVKKNCTPKSDTECNKTCNHGYFFSKSHNCKLCSYCCLDGQDEEQQQCVNQGFKAINRHCSPRPDSTCNPSSPTDSVISTVLSSSPKHLNEPTPQQHNAKIALIVSGVFLFVFIVLPAICFQKKKSRRRRNRDRNLVNETNVEEEGHVYSGTSEFLVCVSRCFLVFLIL